MPWDRYKEVVSEEWGNLLSSTDIGEPEVHSFLEQHPCLLPGYDAFEGRIPVTVLIRPAQSMNAHSASQFCRVYDGRYLTLCGSQRTAKISGLCS
jgi:hypothetical protein